MVHSPVILASETVVDELLASASGANAGLGESPMAT